MTDELHSSLYADWLGICHLLNSTATKWVSANTIDGVSFIDEASQIMIDLPFSDYRPFAVTQDPNSPNPILLKGEILLNELVYNDYLHGEFSRTEQHGQILCPYISLGAVKRLEPTLRQVVRRGALVCAFLKQDNSWGPRYDRSNDHSSQAIELLQDIGVHVSYREKIHYKVLTFDSTVSHFGTCNALSFNPGVTAEAMIRSDNPCKAELLMEYFALDACPICMQKRKSINPPSLSLSTESVGRMITEIREAENLSQAELAERIKMYRSSLSDIEHGRRLPGMNTFFDLAKAMDRKTLWVPSRTVPFIEQYVKVFLDRR